MTITVELGKIRVMGGRRSLYEQIFGIVKYFGYIVHISAYADRLEADTIKATS